MMAGTRERGNAGTQVRTYAGMRVRLKVVALAYLLTIVPAYPLSAQTSLTIYNDGRVLVRRTVEAKVPKGGSTQRLALGALDPATLRLTGARRSLKSIIDFNGRGVAQLG